MSNSARKYLTWSRFGQKLTWLLPLKVAILLISVYLLVGIINNREENQLEFIDSPVIGTHFEMPDRLIGKKLPFHQIYESRTVALHNASFKPRVEGTKTILLWTTWNSVKKTVNYYSLRPGNMSFVHYGCPYSECTVVRDRKLLHKADAILFHVLDIDVNDLPEKRHPKQLWILYNMESPWIIKRNFPSLEFLNNHFNLSMSYREDSDLPVKYGIIERSNSFQDYDMAFFQKSRSVVWFSSDCITDGKREVYVNELQKYIDVDVYGTCGTKKCLPSQSVYCYQKVLKKYKFYLSFENALCKDYVTEKFFNVFNYAIVPVVLGGANYSRIAPIGSFVDAGSFPKPKDLAAELKKIGSNVNLYQQMLKVKSSWKAYLDPWTCKLCEKLHDPLSYLGSSRISDFSKWWVENARCRTFKNDSP